MTLEARIARVQALIPDLRPLQLDVFERIAQAFTSNGRAFRDAASDLVTPCTLDGFDDALRIHHCFSDEPFTKDKFEHALVRVVRDCGEPAEMAPRGNAGHDVTLGGVRFSLKTQADRGIRLDHLLISKYMELGKGEWTDDPGQLPSLTKRFLDHLSRYDRILTLRRLPAASGWHRYELVEIPKALLLEASTGQHEMKMESKQTPKPGYCYVRASDGTLKFRLYFDGGTERKLQIQSLDKRLCIVHAVWAFEAVL